MAKQYLTTPISLAPTTQAISPVFAASDSNGFSDIVYIGGSSLVALFIPGSNSGAAWTQPANIAVYASASDGSQTNAANYSALYKDTGAQYIFVLPTGAIPAAGLFMQIPPYDFIGLDAIQLQSVNTSSPGTPVVQVNSPAVKLITIANGTF